MKWKLQEWNFSCDWRIVFGIGYPQYCPSYIPGKRLKVLSIWIGPFALTWLWEEQ